MRPAMPAKAPKAKAKPPINAIGGSKFGEYKARYIDGKSIFQVLALECPRTKGRRSPRKFMFYWLFDIEPGSMAPKGVDKREFVIRQIKAKGLTEKKIREMVIGYCRKAVESWEQ